MQKRVAFLLTLLYSMGIKIYTQGDETAMKKLVLAVLAVLFIAPAAMAEGWGVGLKLGGAENDPKTMKQAFDNLGGELDKNGAYFGLEVLHEWALNDEANKIGAKIGWDVYGENEYKRTGNKATEDTYSFPFTIYYKRDNGIGKFAWFGGAGVTILRSTLEVSGADDESKTKVFPHIVAGGEYRFTKVFALGLEARYNFSAKVKKNVGGGDFVLSDRTGFGAALTGRFYF